MDDTYIAPHHRINLAFAATDGLYDTWATHISKDAVHIRCREPFPTGTKVSLKFAVLLDEPRIVTGEGTVVRVVTTQPSGMDVRFDTLSPEPLTLLRLVTGEPSDG